VKKTVSFLLTLIMLASVVLSSFALPVVSYATSVNDEDVFVKQSRSGRCTLASAVMMLRRRAIIDDVDEWDEISEDTTEEIAWTSAGLYNNFTFMDMIVGYGTFSGDYDEKKELLLSLLEEHPEGISVYNRDQEKMHAVLVTDYDEADDVFYCADPAGGIEAGRIPIVYAWLPGETQEERIENLDNYWYISNRIGGDSGDEECDTIISSVSSALKKGDLNNHVMELQIALNGVIDAGLVVDSDFGSLTMQAVKDFQEEYELEVTGIADEETLELLNELFGEHVHSFEREYETVHPHKQYKICSCGYKIYNGKTTEMKDCDICQEKAIVKDSCNEDVFETIDEETDLTAKQIVFTIDDPSVIIFGIEEFCDVAPQIVNDRTMLPVRILAESLGAKIEWKQNKTRVVTIHNEDVKVSLDIDKETALMNGREVELDCPAFIDDDRVFVPVRFLAEVFDAEVEWNSETRQVILTVD